MRAARRQRRDFARDERGVTLIEFGILAIPFFALVGAILETALVFLASQILDSAVQDSVRLIATGQAQTANYTAANFRTAICGRLYGIFNCANVKIRTTVLADFTIPASTPPIDPVTGQWTVVEQYTPGSGSQIVMVKVYYKWPIVFRFGGFNLQTSSDGTHLLGASRVFRNEPF